MLAHPRQQLAAIGAIDPDPPQLLAATAQACNQQFCAFGIRKRGSRDDHRQEQAHCVDQQVPFASLDVFAAIVATQAAHRRALDTLTVQTTSGWMFMSASTPSYLGAQSIVDTLPGAIVTPNPEVMIDTFPGRIVLGQHAPLRAADQNVQDRIDELAHIQAARPTTSFGGRDQVFDIIPLAVGQIGRVCVCVHTPSVPYLLTRPLPFQTASKTYAKRSLSLRQHGTFLLL